MHPRRFALVGGIVMLLLGLLSLVPSLQGSALELPVLRLETSYGLFLGLFPMNILNKLALIGFGVWGIAASRMKYRELPASITYSRAVFYVMGALAVLGLIPQTNTLFGYWPLFGAEVALHAVFAVVGAYFGYALSAKVPEVAPRGGPTDYRNPVHGTR